MPQYSIASQESPPPTPHRNRAAYLRRAIWGIVVAGLVLGGVIATGTTMGDRGVPALRSRAALPAAPIGVQLSVAPGHRGVALDPFEEALRRIEKLRGLAPRVEPWLVRRAEKLV